MLLAKILLLKLPPSQRNTSVWQDEDEDEQAFLIQRCLLLCQSIKLSLQLQLQLSLTSTIYMISASTFHVLPTQPRSQIIITFALPAVHVPSDQTSIRIPP